MERLKLHYKLEEEYGEAGHTRVFSENRNKSVCELGISAPCHGLIHRPLFSFPLETFEFMDVPLVALGLILSSIGYGEIFDGFMWKIQALLIIMLRPTLTYMSPSLSFFICTHALTNKAQNFFPFLFDCWTRSWGIGEYGLRRRRCRSGVGSCTRKRN